jgi:predicted DNA-binding transcriptional regulator AlpA
VTVDQLREKYQRLAADASHLGSTVPLAKVCRMVLDDLAELPVDDVAPDIQAPVQLLTVEQVADRLQMDKCWVYRHGRRWKCARKLSAKAIRFDSADFEEELAAGGIIAGDLARSRRGR